MNKEQQKLLESLVEKPSNYSVDVVDNSMLPGNLKDRKSIQFTVKPPSMEVLAKCAIPFLRIPEDIRTGGNKKLEEAIKYRQEMAEVFSILAHGKSSEYPKWYVEFVLNNVTGKELFMLLQEAGLKMQSDFFLHSFQIANETNPMMMAEKMI